MSFNFVTNGDYAEFKCYFQKRGIECDNFRFVNAGPGTNIGDKAMIPRDISHLIKWGINPDYEDRWNALENEFTHKIGLSYDDYGRNELKGLPVTDNAPLTTNYRISDGMTTYEMIGWHKQWVEIDWGDGTIERHEDVPNPNFDKHTYSHSYDSSQEWTVSITGNMLSIKPRWYYISDVQKLNTPDHHILSTAGMARSVVSFNYDMSNWDVSSVVDMDAMFLNNYDFNQSLNNWDVGTVKNMAFMFHGPDIGEDEDVNEGRHKFNQDIGNWDVSNVTDMDYMFSRGSRFNQDIGNWNVSNVRSMAGMFRGQQNWGQSFAPANEFNQDIGSWDVGNVTDMHRMFNWTKVFNQDIGSWDVGNVTDMHRMFSEALGFLQDISSWDVSSVQDWESIFYRCPMGDQDSDGNYIHLDKWPPEWREDPSYATRQP